MTIAASAAVAPIALATPANAAAMDCISWLQRHGYKVGDISKAACKEAEKSKSGIKKCNNMLTRIGVTKKRAADACDYGYYETLFGESWGTLGR
ncbi:hypothetical protein [Streptomyces alkaliterrae]|uniref:Uncharacterized protein n=1 Tax=Streptomyces alkaliterrae TaxID=2213162 RepID=A0A7W3X0A1_9ACTN|nr:hypothetical protein [Streptomyces alkaliterrae]MBB1261779.1 hypothetical protein [Streptomyces alkaliterrae]